MVESIAATSLLGHVSVCGRSSIKDLSYRRKPVYICRFPCNEFLGRRVVAPMVLSESRFGVNKPVVSTIRALAMELTKEAYSYKGEERIPRSLSYEAAPRVLPESRLGVDKPVDSTAKALAMELTKEAYSYKGEERLPRSLNFEADTDYDRKPGMWPPESIADNPALHNPLLRQEMMGSGWLSAIFEWEGVIVEDNPDLEREAWMALCQEEGKSPPLAFELNRVEGMKSEQAISEVLCWSRDPVELRRMAARKEEIYNALQGGIYRFRTGSQEFVNTLMHYKIPMALVSTRPRHALEAAVGSVGIEDCFSVIVAAEDVYRGKPDPEMFIYAAQLLQFIPERCIVFGNSNQTVEAAHDARMKCVAVASKHPVYELSAADLVVTHLDELSVVDLKNLADTESEFGYGKPELEMEEEEEDDTRTRTTSEADDDDFFW